MCGFAGIMTAARVESNELAAQVSHMVATIVHRGPDDEGIWISGQAGVALGFRRLSIIDLSPLGHQPMTSPSGRFVTAFNGEIYNFQELRHELQQYSYCFRGTSDTEVILAAFEHWGIREAVRRFIGMFAIAVWDAERREMSLVRDRLGKKPLYVYREPGYITFGSELKALLAGPVFDRAVDRSALAAYLRYLYIPAPKSIFQHATKLRAGHILTIRDASLPLPASEAYWTLSDVVRRGLTDPYTGSEEDAIDELDALLVDAVRRRMYSDVPLGALLSGGVDSSTVVALMQEAADRPVKTYTIGFDDQQFDESSHAAAVARHLGTDHTALLLSGDDAQTMIPRLPDVFDEPFGDPSQLPTLLVSQLARREVTVALSGDGGDELFGGYNRYVYGTRVIPRISRVPRPMRRLMAAGIGAVPSAAWDRLPQFAGMTFAVPGGRVGERVDKIRHVMNADSVAGMYRSLLSAWQEPGDVVESAFTDADENDGILDGSQPADLLDRMMLADQTTYLPDDLLAKLDRASMAVSLEVRAPILDHRVVQLSWRLPRSLKLRGRCGKWILRQVLFRRVPRTLIERPKMGFSVPIDRWLRGPLRGWGEGLLARGEVARGGLLEPAPIEKAWNDLQDGRRPAGAGLWAVLMFQAWRHRWQV